VNYTDQGRRVGKQLIEVHDVLRGELSELRDILRQVRDGAMRAADARAALYDMTLRQDAGRDLRPLLGRRDAASRPGAHETLKKLEW
jgi:hypothetical protein